MYQKQWKQIILASSLIVSLMLVTQAGATSQLRVYSFVDWMGIYNDGDSPCGWIAIHEICGPGDLVFWRDLDRSNGVNDLNGWTQWEELAELPDVQDYYGAAPSPNGYAVADFNTNTWYHFGIVDLDFAGFTHDYIIKVKINFLSGGVGHWPSSYLSVWFYIGNDIGKTYTYRYGGYDLFQYEVVQRYQSNGLYNYFQLDLKATTI